MTIRQAGYTAGFWVWALVSCSHANSGSVQAFVASSKSSRSMTATRLAAAPRRYQDNADGVLYVNSECIHCSACANFAPTVFRRNEGDHHHIVHHQPELGNQEEVEASRAAMSACPVAAIRIDKDKAGNDDDDVRLAKALSLNPKMNGAPFPRALVEDEPEGHAWYLGHHNERSFGAMPYLASGRNHKGDWVHVMVDTPKFSASAKAAVLTATSGEAPDYLFLSHVDDTADHGKWAEEFSSLRRIFHQGDLGRHNWVGDKSLEHVEVLLQGATHEEAEGIAAAAWNLDGEPVDLQEFLQTPAMGDFVVVHTPGHSPGSISLLKRSSPSTLGILFTGDTYGYSSREEGFMTGFGRYGNDLQLQAQILRNVVVGQLGPHWSVIAPGHGHVRFYSPPEMEANLPHDEMEQAAAVLDEYRPRRR